MRPAALTRILGHLPWVVVYADDILIGATPETAAERLRTVLRILAENDYYMNPAKCQVNRTSIEFCGFVLGQGTIKPSPKQIEAVRDWPAPQSTTQVRSFLGLCTWLRQFIRGFATLSAPLQKLCSKDTSVVAGVGRRRT